MVSYFMTRFIERFFEVFAFSFPCIPLRPMYIFTGAQKLKIFVEMTNSGLYVLFMKIPFMLFYDDVNCCSIRFKK